VRFTSKIACLWDQTERIRREITWMEKPEDSAASLSAPSSSPANGTTSKVTWGTIPDPYGNIADFITGDRLILLPVSSPSPHLPIPPSPHIPYPIPLTIIPRGSRTQHTRCVILCTPHARFFQTPFSTFQIRCHEASLCQCTKSKPEVKHRVDLCLFDPNTLLFLAGRLLGRRAIRAAHRVRHPYAQVQRP
jgi:hypothetical protein